MKKTISEIAKLKKVSRQAVNDFIKKNNIQPSAMKGKYPTYNVTEEPLAGYLSEKHNKPPQAGGPAVPPPPKAADLITKPLNALLADKMPEGKKPSSFFYMRAVEIATKNEDAALLAKLGQLADKEDRDESYQLQMLKTEQAKESMAIEKAARLKLENDIRKEQYFEREKVKLIFGKTYALHTSILIPLSLKLADMINAIPPGPDRPAKIKELIDNEIYAALGSLQRLLIDFVTGEETA